MGPDIERFAVASERAARAGGSVLLRLQGQVEVREKGPADLVTQADLEAENAIRESLLTEFPDHGFLGEEGTWDHAEGSCREFTWIVDPLDGTTNYVHGLPNYSVSIALRSRNEILAGTVYDPVVDACFTAIRDQGATLNGQPLRASRVGSLSEALVAASLPPRVLPNSPDVKRFLEVLYRCQALRRLGSAALNLCYVAAGQLDAYWATSVKTWDIAAGVLLVHEAGGMITNLDGEPLDLDRPQFIAAGHPELHAELIRVLASVE